MKYNGQIIVDVLNTETKEITRGSKGFTLKFQPKKGMSVYTGMGDYSIDSINWSLEHSTFSAWIYLIMSKQSIDYVHEFEVCDWEMDIIDTVDGYQDKFIKKYNEPLMQIIDCDFCKGTGEGGMRQGAFGLTQSLCKRCLGLGKIKKSW